jgi:hypothetical protein
MMALGLMALQLALNREMPGFKISEGSLPITRKDCEANRGGGYSISDEYYRICDRIARGEAP